MKTHEAPWSCITNQANKIVQIESADPMGNQLFFGVSFLNLVRLSDVLRLICDNQVRGAAPAKTLWNQVRFWRFQNFKNWRIFYEATLAPNSDIQISGYYPVSADSLFDVLAKNSDGYQITVSINKLVDLIKLLDSCVEQIQKAEQGAEGNGEEAV